MDVGKKRRLKRIFGQDGKVVIVPMDHGVTLGPVPGILNMQDIIDKLSLGGTDAILIHKGIAKDIDTRGMGLIVHLNASTALSPNSRLKVKVCSIEQANRLGADSVSIQINIGGPEESQMLTYMGRVSDKCTTYGIPLLTMIYPQGSSIKNSHDTKQDSYDTKLIKHAARVGAELGADIIKTNYTGSIETFREVTKTCPVPVVIAGGPKINTCGDVLRMVYDSIQAGGVGVAIGRNIFQHKNPTAMAKAISAIVHKDASVEEGLRIAGGV